MKFKKVTGQDISVLREALSGYRGRVCDYSAGNLVFWRDYYGTEYYIESDGFAVRFENMGGQRGYWCSDNIALIKKINELENGKAVFCCLTKAEIEKISSRFEVFEIEHSRDWDDYIYNASDIAELKGKRFCGQRNHINKFGKLYTNISFEEITCKNAEDVKRFCHEYFHTLGRERAEVADYEENALYEQLDSIETYMQNTLVLFIEGKVAGFSIGETVGDTLIVHTEKADTRYDGVYPVIVKEFARRYASDALFINREEDCGEEGLRRSKLSYHPCEILEKYSISVKPKII